MLAVCEMFVVEDKRVVVIKMYYIFGVSEALVVG